jgi:hypothetical protein
MAAAESAVAIALSVDPIELQAHERIHETIHTPFGKKLFPFILAWMYPFDAGWGLWGQKQLKQRSRHQPL